MVVLAPQEVNNNGGNNNNTEGIPPVGGGAVMDGDDQWEFGSIDSGDGNKLVVQLQKEVKKLRENRDKYYLTCSFLLIAILAIAAGAYLCQQNVKQMEAKLNEFAERMRQMEEKQTNHLNFQKMGRKVNNESISPIAAMDNQCEFGSIDSGDGNNGIVSQLVQLQKEVNYLATFILAMVAIGAYLSAGSQQNVEKMQAKFGKFFAERMRQMEEKQTNHLKEMENLTKFFKQIDQLRQQLDLPKIELIPLPDPRWSSAKERLGCLQIMEGGLRMKSRENGNYYDCETYSQSPFNETIAATALSTGSHALYYYEVEIIEMFDQVNSKDKVYIGFASQERCFSYYVAFAYTGEVKVRYAEIFDWKEYGTGFKKGDVAGCGLIVPPRNEAINGKKAHAFLTVNGKAYKHVAIEGTVEAVFPFASLVKGGTMLEANFGQDPEKPFKYNVWKHPKP